ncbi:DUF4261 domain-containing protein [Novosphingobium sp. FSY-8]|uniref:DUF4261 domain-containing protein n=1 Tax=Novosphingobium ovatum TaxID=1908523 RepID=A0ABW9XGA5_9SPHN|nr:DUF4261 domain-containing protein [Novosphingobium ovatum]NBC37546.1 DUF4261 domain-containing protein [Novosphingobium ovatum]
MAILLLGTASVFPAGALRRRLEACLPQWRWLCGEDDDRSRPDRQAMWQARQVIMGRADQAMGPPPVFVTLEWRMGAYDGPGHDDCPPHHSHLIIAPPTLDNRAQADLLRAILAAEVLTADDARGWVRFTPDTPWLSAGGAALLPALLQDGGALPALCATLANSADSPPPLPAPLAANSPVSPPALAGLGAADALPPDRSARLGHDVLAIAENERALARALSAEACAAPTPHPPVLDETPRPDRLPSLIILLQHPVEIDWSLLCQSIAAIDALADWRCVDGAGPTQGAIASLAHHQRLTITPCDTPLPAYGLELAMPASHWLESGPALQALRHHGAYLTLRMEPDDAAHDWPALRRQGAKVMAMALAVLTHGGAVVGVMNAACGTLFTADQLPRLLAPLHADEVPLQLFVHSTFHSLTTDAVSLSTTGLLPFAGHELETWNAPSDLAQVADILSRLLRYLIAHGPVIGHGDTAGQDISDRALRCFHGPSRAPRAQHPAPPALIVEFEGSPSSPPPRPMPSIPRSLRRPGQFGRKGL